MDEQQLTTPRRKTHGQRKALIVGIISSAVLAVSLVTCIVFAKIAPKTSDLQKSLKGDTYYGLINYENGDWAYGDKTGNFYTYDSDNKLKTTIYIPELIPLNDATARVDHIFREVGEDGKYNDICWMTTVSPDNAEENYLLKLQKDANNSFTFLDYFISTNNISYVLPTKDYVYITSWDTNQKTIIKRLNRNNLKDTPRNGFLYSASFVEDEQGRPTVDYTYKTEARVFSMAESGDNIYISTQFGVTKMNKDFTYNTIMTALKSKYPTVTEYVPASQSPDYLDHLYFRYNDSGETVSKYYCDAPSSVDLVGGAYDPAMDKFIIPTILTDVRTITPSGIDEMITGSTINDQTLAKTGLTYSGKFRNADLHNALTYDAMKQKGILEFQDSANVTLVDFKTNKDELTCNVGFDIFSMVINDKTNLLYYSTRSSDGFGIGSVDMVAMSRAGIYNATFITTLILSIITGITSIICFCGFFFRGYMQKIVETGKNMKKNWLVYAIMIPSMVLLCMFCYYPAIASINLSFYNYTSISPRWEWNSFAHYASIFTSADTWIMFGNTLFFLVFDLILAIVPPLIFAFFLTVMRSKKYSAVIRTLLFLTAIIPGITSILIWKEAFFATENGILNQFLGLFGVKVHWLTDTAVARWSLILMGFPFIGSYLIFYGAMMNIPSSYYEAAELDGITIRKRFFKIDLPLIVPQLKYVFIMTFIHSIQNFSRIYIIYGKTATTYVPKTLIYEMYLLFKSNPVDYGRAAAYATIIFILLFAFTFLAFRTKKKDLEAA